MATNMGKKTWKNHIPVYNTRLYSIWKNMIQRCHNPHNTHYEYYGGKGIEVCEEWKNSKNFIDWAKVSGYEETLTLDRMDGSKNYTPDNCRWITRKEQMFNTSYNRKFTANGETHTVTEWAKLTGLGVNTLTKRLNLGWVGDKLLSPVDRRYSRNAN